MKPAGPTYRPRPGGGFNTGMGQFGEALDESAMQQAGAQKALTQQSASPAGMPVKPGGDTGAMGSQKAPRPVGSLTEELINRPVKDIFDELKQFFSLNTWLGIKPETTDPQKKAKMAAVHKRYQSLTEEQQQVAKRQYQEQMQRKKQEEEEKERKKTLEKRNKENDSLPMPSSPKKGPIGPASGKSKKSNTTEMLNQQRKMLSNPNQGF